MPARWGEGKKKKNETRDVPPVGRTAATPTSARLLFYVYVFHVCIQSCKNVAFTCLQNNPSERTATGEPKLQWAEDPRCSVLPAAGGQEITESLLYQEEFRRHSRHMTQ